MAGHRRMSAKVGSAPRIENAPHYSSGNNDGFVRPEREFRDYEYWMELFAKHLGRYPIPTGPCQVRQMEQWLDRLGVKDTAFHENIFNTSHQDFITLNPGWPLSAWLGTVMEQRLEIQT